MNNNRNISLSTLVLVVLIFAGIGCSRKERTLIAHEYSNGITIENPYIKAEFKKENGSISQTYFARMGKDWIEVANAFLPPVSLPDSAVQLFDQKRNAYRFLSNSLLRDFTLHENEDRLSVTLVGEKNNSPVEQTISLDTAATYFHVVVNCELAERPAKLDYILSSFEFNTDHPPSFVHTPGLKFDNSDSKQYRVDLLPGKDQIIGDRAYHSPAVIVQEGNLFAAIVPDLSAINEYKITSPDARRTSDIQRNKFSVPIEEDKFTMPTGLDLNVMTGITKKPVMSFGYMDNITAHHIRYQRVNESSMIRTLDSNMLQYEFDLFVGADVPENQGFQRVIRHLWSEYGKPVFENRPHLAMPFDEYFRIIDSITFHPITYDDINIDLPLEGYEDQGSWLEWEENGQTLGGYRSAVEWWNDVLHNSAFWNNAREAQGFWYWGYRLDRPDLIKKAKSIINWCLSAPRNEHGLFSLLYKANEKEWALGFTDPVNGNPRFFQKEGYTYDVSTMSKTGAHLLDYFLRCEKDQRIVDYLIPYGDWLLTVIDERGGLPSYVDSRTMEASDILYYSAQPSSSMWFLSELYQATGKELYLKGAEKIAGYLQREIIPEQKWIDMEQFFSCGFRPLEFTRDRWQNQIARGNLATFWAVEGFASLYRATENKDYLKSGELCVDYVSFFQCGWDPHYIYTAFPFGGFSADNADNANYLDARQAEMVRPYIWYGKTLGRQDLIERGVAAARSSVVLINHPRHKANNIYRHTNFYPFGLGPENIDHHANPQSAMRTHPSWGEGSGIFTGLAEASRALGGAYFNFEKDLFVGADGLRVDTASLENKDIRINLTNMLQELEQPWTKTYNTTFHLEGLEPGEYTLTINGTTVSDLSIEEQNTIAVTVEPDGIHLKPLP